MANSVKTKNFLCRFNHTHKLNSVEFINTWTHYDKTEPEEEKIVQLRSSVLKHVDVNKDGKMELGEFASLLPLEDNFLRKFSGRKTLSRKHFNDIFMHYDPDCNGFIEGKELTALIHDIMTKTEQDVTIQDVEDYKRAVLSVFDKNTDGRLSRKELSLLLSVEI